jgi:phage terminase large subunit-like protein
VQTAAVALEQTKNTMRLFPVLITEDAQRHFGIQIGKELIHGLSDTRLIQAVTSSPTTLEGARATFVLKNETQHWDESNDGREMADVIERNATKSPDGSARSGAITNAYEPSNESVAQSDREAWEKVNAGGAVNVGLLYDSLEAPPEAELSPERADDEPEDAYEERRSRGITEVVASICGDSTWLDVPTILKSVLDIRNPPSRSRRFWFNQITASEDAWVSPQEWDASADPEFEVAPKAIITLGFDGSLSDDDSALIGCHVDGDHLFPLGIWSPPKNGTVDRRAIDRAVRAAFELYDVVGFYSDVHPFESYIDTWTDDFADDLIVKSTLKQPIAWDMRDRGGKLQKFTEACERLQAAIIEPGGLTHDGSRRFRIHALNARRAPNKWGVSVRKEHRESARKIDAVPAAVLARLARMDYVALPPSRRRKVRSGKVW